MDRDTHLDWKTNLSPRDIEVCEFICDSPSPLRFNEIKKEVGIHQEKLSRVLKRLVVHGYVTKFDSKYMKCC